LANQLSESERLSFAKSLALRIGLRDSYLHKPGQVLTAGTAKQCSSELPLIAEFLVRRGAKEVFLSALSRPPASPGLTLMLMQLEDMIAFNYTLFTRVEYELLGSRLPEIEQSIDSMLAGPKPIEPRDRNATHYVSKELAAQVKILREAARKAIYLHVSGILRESSSEVNSPVPLLIPNTISASAPTLPDLKQLPKEQQALLLLKRLAHLFPRGRSFSRSNFMIESHLGPDPYSLVTGYPRETQMEAIRYLLGIPWQELVRHGFIFATNADFYELTEEGWTEIGKPISIYTPNSPWSK
jgi:hypothetical protein